MNDLIQTKRLTKKFGSFVAVNNIDLKVPEGVVYGFLGPNGAGKSTTIRMLLGLIKPTDGDVYLFGKSIQKERMEILSQVGSMVESPSYYGHLSAQENLEIVRLVRKADKADISNVLKTVDLWQVKDKKVDSFSLGMKQRLGIAQALIGNPKLLILDEPTNGLDPAGIRQIRNLIADLPEKIGATVLVSSHLLSEIELMANYVGIINHGELLFQGPLKDLWLHRPQEIEIEVSPSNKAEEFLKNRGYNFRIVNRRFVLESTNNPAKINQELVKGDIEVSYLSRSQMTLEDIFLHLTGK